jgi:hypothetical protein
MSRPTQRVSQLITTFGPGAMVDLPTRSVVIGGLERWRYSTPKSLELINEPRLSERIENILKQTGRLEQTKRLSLRSRPRCNAQCFAPTIRSAPTIRPTSAAATAHRTVRRVMAACWSPRPVAR